MIQPEEDKKQYSLRVQKVIYMPLIYYNQYKQKETR
jgi:hypothetical protein